MFEVKVKANFSAAHQLRHYKGKCEELHGHNWIVELRVGREKVNECGMVIDFAELKKILNEVLEEFDHKYINELPYFVKNNPTSENIASYIYDKISEKIVDEEILICSVGVWETENSNATYRD